MAEGTKFKMGRWGWAVVTGLGGILLMWSLFKFQNPLKGWMASTPKAGDPCTEGTVTGTIQADGTCKA